MSGSGTCTPCRPQSYKPVRGNEDPVRFRSSQLQSEKGCLAGYMEAYDSDVSCHWCFLRLAAVGGDVFAALRLAEFIAGQAHSHFRGDIPATQSKVQSPQCPCIPDTRTSAIMYPRLCLIFLVRPRVHILRVLGAVLGVRIHVFRKPF